MHANTYPLRRYSAHLLSHRADSQYRPRAAAGEEAISENGAFLHAHNNKHMWTSVKYEYKKNKVSEKKFRRKKANAETEAEEKEKDRKKCIAHATHPIYE